jgi:hypothetical protein
MGELLNSFHILNRHLGAIDELHLTYSLNRKPSYYSTYPSLSHNRIRSSFATGANMWKRDANRERFIAHLLAPPSPNPYTNQPRPRYHRYQGRSDGCYQLGHSIMLCPTTSDVDKTAWRDTIVANKVPRE